ncbi:MAG: nicotinamide riboside transporter PnuC [Bacteroidales bacterium]|nr:nicotinamide riboside transporter PnuC [Bacteroidales bacterium]MCK9448323.1 nicotinamide riboside transporter PnuC [Bacteroidales bacterium]MDD3701674.1 nicotinamide riboside transporter PnuC [Bacteroidales bacterium]
MTAFDLWELFLNNIYQTSWIEVVAVFFGLLSVWYSTKVNILVYPTGIVSVLIYVYICFVVGLYADMGINVIYFLVSVYGWYNWLRPTADQKQLPVRFNTRKMQWIGIIASVIFFAVISQILVNFTDSTVPYIDAFTTAVFIVGMYFMAEKKVENWIYWIIGDVVSVPLYFYKGLVFTSFQYLIFLILAVKGLIGWWKEANNA